jgi:hypothetical protein
VDVGFLEEERAGEMHKNVRNGRGFLYAFCVLTHFSFQSEKGC